MSTKESKTGIFTVGGKVIEVNIEDLENKTSPGKYTLPDGKEIKVEKEEINP